MTEIVTPFAQFFDTNGAPLNNGAIFIGTAFLDAQTNQIPVFWDDALTIPAAQPIRTLNGYAVRNGAPARIFCNANNFSMTVQTSTGRTVWAVQDANTQNDTNIINVRNFGAIGNGTTNDSLAFQAAVDFITFNGGGTIFVPAGTYLLNQDIVNNGRFPVFLIDLGAQLTGPGRLLCRAEWWTDPFIKRHTGPVAWAFGGQQGTAGQGAVLVGGADPQEGFGGVYMGLDGHSNWLSIAAARQDNPVEFLVYPNAAGGRGTITAGQNTLVRTSGTLFTVERTKYWIDKAIALPFGLYLVQARLDDNTLQLKNLDNSPVSWATTRNLTWHFVMTTGDGSCTVSGTTITRTSGTPFNPFIDPAYFRFYTSSDNGLNWVLRGISSFVNPETFIASSSFGNGTYLYRWELDINQQLSTIRVQKLLGTDEENLTISARPFEYEMRVGIAGAGEYYPLVFYNGTLGPYQPKPMMQINDGEVSVGGRTDAEALRVIRQNNTVNRLEVYGSTAGISTVLASRGSDANVGIAFDTKGAGTFQFTSGTFGRVNFEIFGNPGTSYVGINASTTNAPEILGLGPAADIDIKLFPKGAGSVWIGPWTTNADAAVNGYITVKDAAGNIRKLATIA